ncbi:SAM-dependent methyltransferase [Chitiniphilus purpureus]|uniref:SAM-dependent methyltransferase n=1 Tax=Chitiniphilus purpureus TaxID=2981137 RepID=A0ABY6DPB6_9NEIS|nr:SAM-dependent methyltransferase [Chitiniphilus sp. CD1]UXY16212.1 SAM-dependent methyltransferase [Chitiniphilus sp. CD1]
MIPSQHRPTLPQPDPDALSVSEALTAQLRDHIVERGWLSFADYMALALYRPGLGYYAGGGAKFGQGGDFITAPELSPLFGACVAETIAPVLAALNGGDILEFGAGTGQLAAQVLAELERLDQLPQRYLIVDLSAELADRQRATLHTLVPHLADRVSWLSTLPDQLHGFVLGNEVLDAIPCNLIYRDAAGALFERGVVWKDGFTWEDRLLVPGPLLDLASALDLPCNYLTEIQPQMHGFIASVGHMLQRGAALFIDYGFPASEYYHPQRSGGTLMAHYRHHSLDDPFFLPGLADLTCHVDFSAVYSAADAAGLQLEGYTSQAQYLLDTGLTGRLGRLPEAQYPVAASAVHKLTSPAEMGELFKAMALSRNLPLTTLLPGFRHADDSFRL